MNEILTAASMGHFVFPLAAKYNYLFPHSFSLFLCMLPCNMISNRVHNAGSRAVCRTNSALNLILVTFTCLITGLFSDT